MTMLEDEERVTRSRLVRATGLTAVLTALGSALGFVRDLLIAGVFGATAQTDAFLVAWTVPETAASLLLEGAMMCLLVPMFSRALVEGRDIREVVGATLPVAAAGFLAVTVAVMLGAPWIVPGLAPGMDEQELATACTRVTSITVVAFALAGYASAALRSKHVFGPPAAIYVAYNVGIIALIVAAEHDLGVLAAAWGVAAGSLLMVAVQLPAFLRKVGLPRRIVTRAAFSLGGFVPIATFTLVRQGQVFVERLVGSTLPAGSISHLNFAQKIAQVPMIISLIVATVTFPALARSISAGDEAGARRRVTDDLLVAGAIVLCSTSFLVVFAPEIVRLLLERGAFTAADTAHTAWSMRLYSLGLLGQTVVGVVYRVYFSAERPSWVPAATMGAGLACTAVGALVLAGPLGAGGIALSNAAGITLTAVLLLAGWRTPVRLPRAAVALTTARLVAAAVAAGLAGHLLRPLLQPLPLPLALGAGGVTVTAVFALAAVLTGLKEEFATMRTAEKDRPR
ncbi:lipid II flippase MurJ [Thermoactinospora rubra]|uniref:lipid II flippase MurJ n=1 Tax=Thermoactinospora rubra TaxID=1088767 RepID=UPI000A0F6794|nr:lipid II flippase MurJ [Thermoactinospora rubra]